MNCSESQYTAKLSKDHWEFNSIDKFNKPHGDFLLNNPESRIP